MKLSDIFQYIRENPLKSLSLLLAAQSKLAQAATKVAYLAYPLNTPTSNAFIQNLKIDAHHTTAAFHAVHTGLYFMFDNGSYAELHYGLHKWWAEENETHHVFEFVNNRYPNHWRGDCKPWIVQANLLVDYKSTLSSWQQQGSRNRPLLFLYHPQQTQWEGHLVINDQLKVRSVAIEPKSSIHYELDYLAQDPELSTMTLFNLMRRTRLFGDATPFGWKGYYEIGDLPDHLSYEQAKASIIQHWDNQSYYFGVYDCWEMVIWFAQKHFHLAPEELGGPLGSSWTSAGHFFRWLSWVGYAISHDPALLYQQSTDNRSYINSLFIKQGKVFENWRKEIRYFLTSLSASSYAYPILLITQPLLIVLTWLLPILPIVLLAKFLYQFSTRQTRQAKDVDKFLQWMAKQISGPTTYKGLLENKNPDEIKQTSYLSLHQLVARSPTEFLAAKNYEIKERALLDAQGNRFFCMEMNPLNRQADRSRIAFYIPGTASSVNNQEISNAMASHLANALQLPMILIAHRLTPAVKWPIPFYDVWQAILHYVQTWHAKEIVISGYSSGGLYATLAAFMAIEHKIKVARLILFAPLLDLAGELAHWEEADYNKNQAFLPEVLRHRFVEYNRIKRQGSKDSIANPKQLCELIDSCFTEHHSKQPRLLRHHSPNWLPVSVLKKIKLPDTTMIVGENDFYRPDAEIFYAKLIQAKKSAQFVLLTGADHSIMWHALYPVYISKPLHLLKTPLRMVISDKTLNESDRRLKVSYQALMTLRKQHAAAKKKNPHIDETDESTHWQTIDKDLSDLENESETVIARELEGFII